MKIGNYDFKHICSIQPDRDAKGTIVEYFPHKELEAGQPLVPFGEGPLCRFKIPDNLSQQGVYALTIDNTLIYHIGESIKLSQRFNSREYGGYGLILPQACLKGGQVTNVRVNYMIYRAIQANIAIDLWFYETKDRASIKDELIALLKPKWNVLGVTTN